VDMMAIGNVDLAPLKF